MVAKACLRDSLNVINKKFLEFEYFSSMLQHYNDIKFTMTKIHIVIAGIFVVLQVFNSGPHELQKVSCS